MPHQPYEDPHHTPKQPSYHPNIPQIRRTAESGEFELHREVSIKSTTSHDRNPKIYNGPQGRRLEDATFFENELGGLRECG